MSTRLHSDDTRPEMTTRSEPQSRSEPTTGAPLMFATDNEVRIRGLFEAESEDHGA